MKKNNLCNLFGLDAVSREKILLTGVLTKCLLLRCRLCLSYLNELYSLECLFWLRVGLSPCSFSTGTAYNSSLKEYKTSGHNRYRLRHR